MAKILLVGPAWVGDTVMSQSLVAALKQQHPAAAIHLMAPPWTAPLGERMPGISATHEFAFHHGRLQLRHRFAAGRALRRERFDLAIMLPNSLKSAIPAFVARIPVRRGYIGEWRYGLLNDPRTLDKSSLPRTVDRFAALAGSPSAHAPAVSAPLLRHDAEAARRLVRKFGSPTDTRPMVILCPGAEYGPAKQWPARHFAKLAGILEACGYACWMLGSKKDQGIAAEIVALASGKAPPLDLCGKTSLLEAMDLIGQAVGVVTNDSGLMHIAAALDRPLVTLFGSTTPAETPPLASKVRIVERVLPCRPCFARTCPLGHLDCLATIAPDEVADAFIGIVETAA